MDFLKDAFDAFIPHEGNGYKPNFFRLKAVLFMAVCVLVLAAGAFFIQARIQSGSLAAVISSVLINLTNTDRSANGLPTLALNPTLTAAAQLKANDMAAKGYFAHTSPDGVSPWYWFKQAGYTFEYAGENLAVRFSDSIDVEVAWMNSPTHRANILNSHFTEIGIATAQGTYQGQTVVFVVQEFGNPAQTVTPAPKPALTVTPAAKPVSEASSSPVGIGTANASSVAGTSTEDAAPRVIIEDPTFIAVQNPAGSYPALATSAPQKTSVWATLLTSPTTVASAVYLLLALLVFIGLIVMIVFEIRHQHPWNVALGIALLALLIGLCWVFQSYFTGQLLVL